MLSSVSAGWLTGLPLLGVGMGFFWLQREAGGGALGIVAIVLLVLALLSPGLLAAWLTGRRGVVALLIASGKGLAVALVCLVLASLLSMVEALRPEEISFFGADFAAAHAIAAAVPTVLALAAAVVIAWTSDSARRFVWMGIALVGAVAGVLVWRWSAGIGYEAIRFTNADEIVLMAQTVTLAALLLASVATGFLAGRAAAR